MTKCYFPFPENQRPHRIRKLHTTFWAMLAMLFITISCQTKAQPFSSALEIGSADLDGAISVFVGDVNGDGHNDVIAVSLLADNLAWFENDGDPGDGDWTRWEIDSGTTNLETPRWVYGADLDRDDDLDVIVTAIDSRKITWYENDGLDPPGWTLHTLASPPQNPGVFTAADIDKDGNIDVIASASGSGLDQVTWYENDCPDPPTACSVPTFIEHVIKSADNQFVAVDVADVDGDTHLDVIAAEQSTHSIVWFKNDGTPGGLGDWVETKISDGGVDTPGSIFASDIDGDTNTDVLSTSAGDQKIYWHENTAGDGSAWTLHTIATVNVGGGQVFAADLGGGSSVDVLAALTNESKITVYENMAGDGSSWDPHDIDTGISFPFTVYAAKVDGDASIDVVSASFGSDKVVWYQKLGTLLPVELTSFEAYVVEQDAVRLVWETASETNNAGFEVQSKLVGANLEKDEWQVL